MAHILPSRFSAAFLLSSALLLGGCCANNVCNCEDSLADAVELRFSSAFTPSELDTIIIKRYALPVTVSSRPDSVVLFRTTAHARDSILLNNSTPFSRVGNADLGRYRYEIRQLVQPTNKKPRPVTFFVIDGIAIQGSFDGSGCCTCYTNTKKVASARRASVATDSIFDLKSLPKPILKITR